MMSVAVWLSVEAIASQIEKLLCASVDIRGWFMSF